MALPPALSGGTLVASKKPEDSCCDGATLVGGWAVFLLATFLPPAGLDVAEVLSAFLPEAATIFFLTTVEGAIEGASVDLPEARLAVEVFLLADLEEDFAVFGTTADGARAYLPPIAGIGHPLTS